MVRTSIELATVLVLAIVLLTLLGVVLYKGGERQAPPGDALVVTQTQDFASLDPALAQTQEAWELEYATCAKLLNYPAAGGYRGTRLVPEVATALPRISRDRRTYIFDVRPGWRFSDGEPVTPALVRLARSSGRGRPSSCRRPIRISARWPGGRCAGAR